MKSKKSIIIPKERLFKTQDEYEIVCDGKSITKYRNGWLKEESVPAPSYNIEK